MRRLALLCLLAAACGDDGAHLSDGAPTPDAAVDAAPDAPPAHLSVVDADGAPLTGLTFSAAWVGDIAVLGFDVVNDGESPTAPLAVNAGGPAFTVDVSTTCTTAVLAPGDRCHVGIQFIPAYAGTITGSATVTSDGIHTFTTLVGAGFADLNSLDASGGGVSELFFSAGDGSPHVVYIEDMADVPTMPLVVGIEAPVGPFNVDSMMDTCSGVALAPGGRCEIAVRMNPAATMTALTTLVIANGEDKAGVGLIFE